MSNNFKPVMRSPLDHFHLAERQQPVDDSRGVWAVEVPLLGYISLRGNAALPAFPAAVKNAIGVDLPTQPCALHEAEWGSILWLSPDEWLLICDRPQRQSLQHSLEAALAGIHSQVVDNSGGFTTVMLQGRNVDDVLHHCTVYDIDSLEAGRVVGTTFGKMSAFLLREDDGFGLVFRRSFADYIWRLLERSAEPYGLGIAAPAIARGAPLAHPVVSEVV